MKRIARRKRPPRANAALVLLMEVLLSRKRGYSSEYCLHAIGRERQGTQSLAGRIGQGGGQRRGCRANRRLSGPQARIVPPVEPPDIGRRDFIERHYRKTPPSGRRGRLSG